MALFDFLKKKKKLDKAEGRGKKAPSDIKGAEVENREEKPRQSISAEAISDDFVLLHPRVTERARNFSEHGQYTFVVGGDATKRQVKNSVERLYKTRVKAVRMVKIHSKPRRRGLTMGTKKGYKKAIVSLKGSETIDIF